MNIIARKINNYVVNPVPIKGQGNQKPPRAVDLFSDPMSNVYINAKKKSGKTSTLYYVLKKIMSKDTKLIIFCSTVHKDPMWKQMVKEFKAKGYHVETYTSLKEDNVDLLQELVTSLENNDDPNEEEEYIEPDPVNILQQKSNETFETILNHNTGTGNVDPIKKKKPSKYLERKYIVVLDDLSTELKSKSLVGLMKKQRHFLMNIYILSQYYRDLLPEVRTQIDVYLLFKGQTDDKLQAVYKDADISITWEQFKTLYDDATHTPYSFFYIDARNEKFRKNFNIEYEI